jgi:hypothetical protein
MTLILSLATPHFAVQVSDRMVTFLRDGAVKNPYTIKMVQCGNHMLFGFTGLAELEMQSTDRWLAQVIAHCPASNLTTITNTIIERAKRAYRWHAVRQLSARERRLAFVGAGFARNTADNTYYPIMVRITNFHNEAGQLQEAQADFRVQHRRYMPPSHWGWNQTPAHLTTEEELSLATLLSRCAKRNTGPAPVVRLFRDAIRGVSRRLRSSGDLTVGEDLLVGVIPRSAVDLEAVWLGSADGRGCMVLGTGPRPPRAPNPNEMPAFLDLSADTNDAVQSSPLVAYPGQGLAGGPLTITIHPRT